MLRKTICFFQHGLEILLPFVNTLCLSQIQLSTPLTEQTHHWVTSFENRLETYLEKFVGFDLVLNILNREL